MRFAILVLCCGLVSGCGGKAVIYYSPAKFGNPAHPPAVRLILPRNGAKYHAHDDIRMLALATPHGSDLGPDREASKRYADSSKWHLTQSPGDTVSVQFFAGSKGLGFKTSGMVAAGLRSRRGEAVPMIVGLAGYPAVEWVWHNAPPGTYYLTARAANQRGQTTISPPVKITVLP
jgi:hypothetical protein